MKSWIFGAALAATALSSQTAAAFDYKAHRDFSYVNPTGVWSYGKLVALVFTPFTNFVTNGASTGGADAFAEGDFVIGVNTTGKNFLDTNPNTVIWVNNVIHFHPSPEGDPVVRFKVPETGSYLVEGFFQIQDTRPAGGTVRAFVTRNKRDGTYTVIRHRVLSGPASASPPKPGERWRFAVSFNNLRKGEFILFGVGPDGSHLYDSVGFDARITKQE